MRDAVRVRRPKFRLAFSAIVAAWVAIAAGAAWSLRAGDRSAHAASWRTRTFRERAITIPQRRLPLLDIDETAWRRALERLHYGRKDHPPGTSGCLHLLRLYGLDARFAEGPLGSSAGLLRAVSDADASKAIFTEPAFVRSKYGIRYRPIAPMAGLNTASVESHPNQNLSALAEAGLPLSHPLTMDDRTFTLRDVLCDLIAQFDLNALEFEWTALAVVLFLPSTRVIENRYGERTTIDDVARKLMATGSAGGSCGGTHVLYSLICLLQADRQEPVLDPTTRAELDAYVRRAVDQALATQEPDGSWGYAWRERRDGGDSVIVTGHLIECFLRLPEALQPSDRVYRRAGEWMLEKLLETKWRSVGGSWHCPYTHLAIGVRQLKKGPLQTVSQ